MRALFLLAFAWGSAQACGYCVEDKIAAVYDHALISQALAAKHPVVFMHVEGPATKQALEQAAQASGADRGSVRVSGDLLTVSFSFDPRRGGLGPIHAAMEKRLKGVSLMPFQVMDKPGDLKAISRR
ncbi:MAG TPA: hypothetical protein VNU64_12395 [Burkholderiales bacterium]|nr:hypothetical protein [Burkholderiales bacterium]